MQVPSYNSRGIALVEALMALALFSLTVTSVWVLVFRVDDSVFTQQNDAHDISRIYDTAELSGLNSFSVLSPSSQHTYNYVTPCLAEEEVGVGEGETFSGRISTKILISDLEEVLKRGGDCFGYPDVLQGVGGVQGGRFSLSPAGSQTTGVDIVGSYGLVSFINADPQAPDLLLFDGVHTSPRAVTTVDVGSGLNSIDGTMEYVYGALKDGSGQLVVLDTHHGGALEIVASSTLPGVAGAHPEGWSIFYYDSRVYVGTRRTAGNEFHIFDVSHPRNPVWLGSREINHNINDIVVRDGVAYLATSGNTRDLIVLDVIDPQHITQIAALDVLGGEDGRTLSLVGDTLYMGRLKSIRGNPDFFVLDVGPVNEGYAPRVIGSYTVGGDVNSIIVAHGYAYLGTAKRGAELTVLNIASSTNITVAATEALPYKVTKLDSSDNAFFASLFGEEGIFTFSSHE